MLQRQDIWRPTVAGLSGSLHGLSASPLLAGFVLAFFCILGMSSALSGSSDLSWPPIRAWRAERTIREEVLSSTETNGGGYG